MVSLTLDKLVESWRLRIENLLNELGCHSLSPDNFPDSPRQHEFDFAGTDFFVEPHGGEKSFALIRVQLRLRPQAGTVKQVGDALEFARGQTQHVRGKSRGGDLADG